jgi:hypothetical protein
MGSEDMWEVILGLHISLPSHLSHHFPFSCTNRQPHRVPSTTNIDSEVGGRAGPKAGSMCISGLTHFLPTTFTKAVWRRGQKDVPCNHNRNLNPAIFSKSCLFFKSSLSSASSVTLPLADAIPSKRPLAEGSTKCLPFPATEPKSKRASGGTHQHHPTKGKESSSASQVDGPLASTYHFSATGRAWRSIIVFRQMFETRKQP